MAGEKLPNFFIVGAPRAGTTSLYEYLRRVPGIYMSPVKEPRYFAPNDGALYGITPIRDRVQYLKLFNRVKDEKAVGEASPSYLADPDAPRLIHEAVPHARIITILRDPIERAFSHYLMHVRRGWQSLPFEEAMREKYYLEPGFYAVQVKRHLDTFGCERVKILIFEEFIERARAHVADVLKFLGVDGEPPEIVEEAYNTFGTPRGRLARLILDSDLLRSTLRSFVPAPLRRTVRERVLFKKTLKPAMSRPARRYLEDVYREDVLRLKEILGRPLPWPLARG